VHGKRQDKRSGKVQYYSAYYSTHRIHVRHRSILTFDTGESTLIFKQGIQTPSPGMRFCNIVKPNVQDRAYGKYSHLHRLLGSKEGFLSISTFSILAMSLSDALVDVDLCQNSVGSSRAKQNVKRMMVGSKGRYCVRRTSSRTPTRLRRLS
jgi:hypothetical protein